MSKTDFWLKKFQKNKLSVGVSNFASRFVLVGKTTSKNIQQFLHGVRKTGVPIALKSDISQTKPNLNNCVPKLRISFTINMINMRYISKSVKKVGQNCRAVALQNL